VTETIQGDATQTPAPTSTDASFDVFLSHNGDDKPAVERIAERLARAGFRPWLDVWALTPGGRWQDELHEGLLACRSFAYFIGPSGEGDWAREELDAARSRAVGDREFRMFPVLLPGVPDPFDRTTMPPFLGARTWVDFRDGLEDPRALQALINAIKGVPLGMAAEAAPAPDTVPYRGLEAFDEADAEFYFGREPDIQTLLEKLKAARLLAVMGPSGSGKSSLVRAGLVPALRRGALPGSQTWPIEIFKPGARPLEMLAARLLAVNPSQGMQPTLDGLAGDERTLHLASTLALGDDARRRFVWVVDQAEEMFTLCHDDQERARFVDNLVYAASVPGGRCVVVLSMRADFYARCAAYPELAGLIARAQHLVGPMTGDGIRDAIEEPARRVGLEFEQGLVGTILDDLEGQPGALPLLQYALLELWKRRRGTMLTLEGYRESGGVQGAIAQRAEQIYASFDRAEQEVARRVLLRLTEQGEGTEDTRRRAAFAELVTGPEEARQVAAVVGELTDARLLTATADPTSGEGLVDISHEALIRAWPRVRQWLDEDRAGQRVLRRLSEASQEWQRLGEDEGLLYRGARLAEAEEWCGTNDAMLNDLERRFVHASVGLRERERLGRERRRRVATGIAGGLAAVFLVLAGVAVWQWAIAEGERAAAQEAAQLAESRLLATQALNQTDALDRGLLLSLEANRRSSAVDVRGSLLRLLTAEPRLVRFAGPLGGSAAMVAISGDGSRIGWYRMSGGLTVAATNDPDTPILSLETPIGAPGEGPIWLALDATGARAVTTGGSNLVAWDVGTGGLLWSQTLTGPAGVARTMFTGQDGVHLAVAREDGSVILFDAGTGQLVRESVPALPTMPVPIAFTDDGTRIVRATSESMIEVWSVADGQRLEEPYAVPPPVIDLSFAGVPTGVLILHDNTFGIHEVGNPTQEYTTLATGVPDAFRIIVSGDVEGGFLTALTSGIEIVSRNQGIRYLSLLEAAQTNVFWEPVERRAEPSSIAVAPRGDVIVVGYADGRIGLVDIARTSALAEPWVDRPTYAAPDARATAIGPGGTVQAWYDTTATALRVHSKAASQNASLELGALIAAVAVTSDGSRVVTVETPTGGGAASLVVRQVADETTVYQMPLDETGWRVAISDDDRTLALGNMSGAIELRDAASGALIRAAPVEAGRGAVTALAFTPDGESLLVGVMGKGGSGGAAVGGAAVLTLAVDTATPVSNPIAVPGDRVSAIAQDPGGCCLAVAIADDQTPQDGRILLVDRASGAVMGNLGTPGDTFGALRYVPGERNLLSMGQSPASTFTAWNAHLEGWVVRACEVAARNLTAEEWQTYLGDEPYRSTCAPPTDPAGS
jgi:WD40 repeat protein